MSFFSNPRKATKAFFRTKQPPAVQTQANNPIANRFAPIDFTSIFNEISQDTLDIVRGTNGKLMMTFGNNNERFDLSQPVVSRGINTKLPTIDPAMTKAASVVSLSESMTRLGNVIEQMENSHPDLIEQNQGLISSFRKSSEKAIERGFDFKQHSIDQRLTKMGLSNSSTSLGVQIALAREKVDAYASLELNQAQLSQNLKQQSLDNLQQRGALLGQNANIEQNRFNAENQTHLANQEMLQKQATTERQLQSANEEQRISTEFANRNLVDQRQARMAELGANSMKTENGNALSARHLDNQAVNQQNHDSLARFGQMNNPWEHEVGRKLLSTAGSFAINQGIAAISSNKNNSDPRNNTTGWSPTSTRLIGNKWT